MKVKPIVKDVFYYIFTAVLLCVPAIYNGYVLFYTDSALYLEASSTLVPTIDRPIGYAYFIRFTSLETSLWLTIFMQGLIASLLIGHTIQILRGANHANKILHFTLILFLVFATPLGWFTGQLMPDVMTSLMILGMFNLIAGKNTFAVKLLYMFLIFLAVIAHSSNIPVLTLLLLVTALFVIIVRKMKAVKLKVLKGTLLVTLTLSFAFVFLMQFNKTHFSKYTLSPSGGTFLFARLIDTGIMHDYLNGACVHSAYNICAYKDSIPDNSQEFLWHTNSVFYTLGGWHHFNNEASAIVRGVFLSPQYYPVLVKDFTISALKQLTMFRVGEDFLNFVDGAWAPVYEKCLKSFPKAEMKTGFRLTRQAREELDLTTLNFIFYLVVILSAIIIFVAIIRYKLNEGTTLFVFLIVIGVLINAAACANLSNVLNRYHARVVWLLPLAAFVLITNCIYPEFKKKATLHRQSRK